MKKRFVYMSIAVILVVLSAKFTNQKYGTEKNQSVINAESIESLQISTKGELMENNDISITIVNSLPLKGNEKIEYNIINNTNDEITYGEIFYLEVYDNGNWYNVDWKEKNTNYAWTAMGTTLKPKAINKETIDLSLYEIYPSHKYRIVKEFYNNSIAYTEFNIK